MLRRGSLSSAQVAEVAEARRSKRRRIGALALRGGMLTVRQIFAVVEHQSITGKQFGETAVQLGYLTRNDVDCLIALQIAESALSFEAFADVPPDEDESSDDSGHSTSGERSAAR